MLLPIRRITKYFPDGSCLNGDGSGNELDFSKLSCAKADGNSSQTCTNAFNQGEPSTCCLSAMLCYILCMLTASLLLPFSFQKPYHSISDKLVAFSSQPRQSGR